MSHSFGERSLKNLEGVHPDLVAVHKYAIAHGGVDYSIIEGVRSEARQKQLYAQGRTVPGKIVTWTLKSNHFIKPDGFGWATDCTPFHGHGISPWPDAHPPAERDYYWIAFDKMAKSILTAAKVLQIKVRWGADWDMDGNPREKGESDSPHFELYK